VTSARVFFTAAVAVVVVQLMLPPVIGVANNGDFSRTYGIFHLTMPVADEVRFADTRYRFDPQVNYFGGFYSSETLLVPAALGLNAILSKDGAFDVRSMGLVHGAMFLAAFYLLLTLLSEAPWGLRWLVGGLALAAFGDVMYVAYLNSFYTDVAAYLFLLLSVVLALRVLRWRRRADMMLLGVASLLLVTSKAQHSALGFWLAGFFCVLAYQVRLRNARWFAPVLVATAVLWLWKSTPGEYAARGCFSTIFSHVLPHSKDVDRTLADLGLDQTYRPYIGMVSFSGGSPMGDPRFVAAFSRKVTYRSLAMYLLTHPREAYVSLRVSLDEAGRQRPAMGNFDPSAGLPPYAESRAFAGWSGLKRTLFDRRGSRFLTCFGVTCAVVVIMLICQRRSIPAGGLAAGLFLVGMACTELAVSSLADAMEAPRHHLLFYALFDMLLLSVIWLAGRLCAGRTIDSPHPPEECKGASIWPPQPEDHPSVPRLGDLTEFDAARSKIVLVTRSSEAGKERDICLNISSVSAVAHAWPRA
jgi:hypothetical protein